jgi:hypothetical protein
MRRLVLFSCFLATLPLYAGSQPKEIQFTEAQKVALTVARHENIEVDDRTTVLESMDTRNDDGFIPGYYSFAVIHEGLAPGQPDDTIRMYIVSKRTADTWEYNLCRHYSFPELSELQESLMQQTGATQADNHDVKKDIGCSNRTQAQTSELQ